MFVVAAQKTGGISIKRKPNPKYDNNLCDI
jgi:hypothetical protein